jgi:magnesium transporter
MVLDLKFSIGTLGLGSGAFVAALYGMNLKNFLEESEVGFMGVTGWCAAFVCVVCAYGLTKLRKVQRISMWGESGRKGPNWRYTEGQLGSNLDQWRREKREWHQRLQEERRQAHDMRALAGQQRSNQGIMACAAKDKS